MAIMDCYPDRRAIENELGGKWELFFEETREEAGAVGYEWDKDHDDESPLNLNGVLFIITQDGVASSNTIYLVVNGNRVITLNNSTTAAIGINSWLEAKVKNGLIEATGKVRNTLIGTATLYTGNNAVFTNNITNFSVNLGTLPSGTNIKVYVLRGV